MLQRMGEYEAQNAAVEMEVTLQLHFDNQIEVCHYIYIYTRSSNL